MLGLFNQIPANPCGTTATATQRPGLRNRVNVSGRGTHYLTKPGNVAPSFRGRIGLISARIRRAFTAQPADEPAGDYPPASDCWPMELVVGRGVNGFGFVHHAADYVGDQTMPSPGKFPTATAPGESH